MNSIIKQIHYEQSKQILGLHKLEQFIGDQTVCIFFIADWSVPSRLISKRLKNIQQDNHKIGFVDVDLVDNIELCEIYQVKAVPHCLVFQKNKAIFEFVGMDIEKLNEALQKIKTKSIEKDEGKISNMCENSHELQVKVQLPYPPYINDFFYCNECKKIQKCSAEFKVYHCSECDYDKCSNCIFENQQK